MPPEQQLRHVRQYVQAQPHIEHAEHNHEHAEHSPRLDPPAAAAVPAPAIMTNPAAVLTLEVVPSSTVERPVPFPMFDVPADRDPEGEAKWDHKDATPSSKDEDDDDDWVDHIEALKRSFGEDCDESASLRRFVDDHAHEFAGMHGRDLLEMEHSARHAMLHKQYLETWERDMEDFCRRQHIDLSDLREQMLDALNDRYTALFEEHPHHGWVDSAIAALSYDHFFARMCAAASTSARK